MAATTVPSRFPFPQHPSGTEATRRSQLAVRLADAIVSRSYAPTIWSVYRRRFAEVLEAERHLPELC